ncbi:MAG TPA: amino acid adenylation domain-containing protein [Candidatus Angelobacter sp.]|nr:amino acid adenylation domain-containing protein [Candidatus Angelobacter sp.]
MDELNQSSSETDIAIVGLSGRFPGAQNCEEFWRNLANGIEPLSHFDEDELVASGIAPERVRSPEYVRKRFILDNIDLWDARFFGCNPNEARMMDPQQRIFFECAYEALESAGHIADSARLRMGVFAGSSPSSYRKLWKSNESFAHLADSFPALLANDREHLVTKLSYKFNLRGPGISINTACSTSLVAVSMACQSLISGECDMALAGGCAIHLPQVDGLMYQEGGINSPDGHCRPFDIDACGTVAGNGVGVVALKRMDDALADGNTIYAVIKGYAINNDGSLKIGYTAPSVDGQAEVIAMAQALAGVEPETIDYIETHGTATHLGDPIEVAALTKAFRTATKKKQFCAIGSVKSNIGHLDAAAGIAGLFKVVLALQHAKIPPSLHFHKPNPKIDFENSPFFVNTELRPWKRNGHPRRAGVSSFGVGGTNVHMILEEAPAIPPSGSGRDCHVLLLSAGSEEALSESRKAWAEYLQQNPELNLSDSAYTSQVGRKAYAHRQAVLCSSQAAAVAALSDTNHASSVVSGHVPSGHRSLVFLCSGQGSQYINMGRHLYDREPIFREQFDKVCDLLEPVLKQRLLHCIFPSETNCEAAAVGLCQTKIAQPALFCLEYALAQTWKHWGIKPDALMGHSLGEYVAACLAGVFSVQDAARLVSVRGRLMQKAAPGAMLAVNLNVEDASRFTSASVSIAAMNGPSWTVLSGLPISIEQIEQQLRETDTGYRRLHTSHAFHSFTMNPILDSFRREVGAIRLSPPQIPFISNLTGTWITDGQATDPGYWVQHLREPVRFAEGAAELLWEPNRVYLEIGPGEALGSLVRSCADGNVPAVISSLPRPDQNANEIQHLTAAIARLWTSGIELDWKSYHSGERRLRVPLPTYPFQRQSYWIPSVPVGKKKTNQSPANAHMKSNAGEKTQETEMRATASEYQQNQRAWIQTELRTILSKALGCPANAISGTDNLVNLGFDSLLLIQVASTIKKAFKVKVPFRSMVQELSVIDGLTDHLAEKMGEAGVLPEISPTRVLPSHQSGASLNSSSRQPETKAVPADAQTKLYQSIEEQLASLAHQLKSLRHMNNGHGFAAGNGLPAQAASGKVTDPVASGRQSPVVNSHYVPFQPIRSGGMSGITLRQQQHIEALIKRYCSRTAASKKFTQDHRSHLADNRALLGFRLLWKELVYPVVAQRSMGSRIWDLDGNEYIDMTMGFGVHLFGHSPAFVTQALQRQIHEGFALGPQSEFAGEVAREITELTKTERVAFCNSGTEAIMASIRLARTATGRSRIAMFAGAYHGTSDATLGRLAGGGEPGTIPPVPVAPGIAPSAMNDLLMVPYGTPRSLEILQSNVDNLAAILVEPVQSRRPDIQPAEFLQNLRSMTHKAGTALIFDDMIMGFRLAQGGTQEWFGIKSDLVTYGKVVGGGMPLGVVAGARRFMDAIDGGWWQYGDSSYPKEDQTLFAGTFFKHPLTMVAALAVLQHLKAKGPALQESLNQRTAEFVKNLNECLERNSVPMRVVNCGSLVRFLATQGAEYLDLFFYHLVEKGVFIWEGRTAFVSTAHSDEDLQFVLEAFEQSAKEMQAGGFFVSETSEPSDLKLGSVESVAVAVKDITPALTKKSSTVQQIPTTKQQQQLWALSRLGDDTSAAYNSSMTLKLRGILDTAALARAIEKLVARHDALRVTFSDDGEWQHIHSYLNPDLTTHNFVSAKYPEQEASAVVFSHARALFDLTKGPLLRVATIKLGPEYHWLVITAHHLIFDGWSSSVVLNDLHELYKSEKDGTPPRLASVTPLLGLVQRQNEQQDNDGNIESESFWLQQLSGEVPVLELPTDWPRPSVQTYDGHRTAYTIPASVMDEVRKLQNREGWTIFAVLFAAFNVLLHRISGQQDIICGTPAAAQAGMDEANVVGYGVNVLPVRSCIAAQPAFAEYVAATQQRVLEACEHQDVSLLVLVRKLRLRRDPSRSPLVNVLFNLDRSRPVTKMLGTSAEIMTNTNGTSKFDMDWNVTDNGQQLLVECDYNTRIFSEQTMQRWIRHFQTILKAVTTNPELTLSKIPLLAETERRQILENFNATSVQYPAGVCVPHLIEAQVKCSPKATAVVFREKHLSYDEMNNRANAIAQLLIHKDIRAGSLVPVLMERGLALVPALLAIMKLGAAYVPLDSRWPDERLKQVIEELHCPVLVTDTEWCSRAAVLAQSLLNADEIQPLGAVPSPQSSISPSTPIYAIYTSGSTGNPKAAVIPHRGIMNRFFWMDDCFGPEAAAAALQTTPHIYDSSVWQLFWPLVHGGRTVLPHDGSELTAIPASTLIATNNITISDFAFSVFDAMLPDLLNQPEMSQKLSSLRVLIIGSEAVRLQPVQAFHKHFPKVRLFDLYGPTEASIGCIYHEITGEEDGRLPIGRPISNVQAFILDEWMQPVPVGITGEIYLGGACVGLGYFNQPALTVGVFMDNPFGEGKLYKTGDLARYAPDGTIDYLGRKDHQIKIFGLRIELGEIESALAQHPAVQQCAMALREDVPNEKRLIAYLVARNGNSAVSETELKNFLKQNLPAYMVPAAFMWLPEIPRTAANKIDRSRLPIPEKVVRPADGSSAPRNNIEKELARIWSEVLRLKSVGIHDNFFDLGGDSILAIHIIAKANSTGIRLNPKLIFQYQTIAELALAANAGIEIQAEQGIVEGNVPFTPIVSRFFERTKIDSHHYNQSFFFECSERLDAGRMEQAVRLLVEHHDALRLRFSNSNGEWRQVNSCAQECSFQLVDLRDLPSETLPEALTARANQLQSSFNLEHGPLFKVILFRLPEHESDRLLILAHHLVIDGVSWQVLLADLEAVYRQIEKQTVVELPPKTTSFKYWAERLVSYAQSTDLKQELDFWISVLNDGADAHLPCDMTGGVNIAETARYISICLTVQETDDLLHRVPKAYNTQINDVLLAALGNAVGGLTGKASVLIDLEGHGREALFDDVDLSRTVGWFTSLFPVRLHCHNDPGELLNTIKGNLRKIPRSGIGYGLLRHLCNDPRSAVLRSSCEPQILFNYQGQVEELLDSRRLLRIASVNPGILESKKQQRNHLLDVNAMVIGGRLQADWTYSNQFHRKETILALAESFREELRCLISHCVHCLEKTPSVRKFRLNLDESSLRKITASGVKTL